MLKCCIGDATVPHVIMVFVFLLANLSIWVYSVFIVVEIPTLRSCLHEENEVHCFLVYLYAGLYSVVYLGVLLILGCLHCDNKVITVFEKEKRRDR